MFDEFLFVVVESTCHGCVFPDARAAAAADDEPRIPGTARTACAGHDGAEPGPAEAATIFRDSGERDGDQTSAGLVERPDQGNFTPTAFMKLTLWKDNQRKEAKPFEIGVPILPRFFLVTTQSGVRSMSLALDGARERNIAPGHSIVECVSAVWTYRYASGYSVTLRGALSAHVLITATPASYSFKFDEFTFDANLHDKFISLDALNGSPSSRFCPQQPLGTSPPTRPCP